MLEPLAATGKRESVVAFRLDSVDADASAIPRNIDSRLIGRMPELERLNSLFEEVAAGRGARQVTVIGEPGIGKSRLARAFLAELASDATVLIGRCPPYGEGATFWPLQEVLGQAGRDETVLRARATRYLLLRAGSCSSWPVSGRSSSRSTTFNGPRRRSSTSSSTSRPARRREGAASLPRPAATRWNGDRPG